METTFKFPSYEEQKQLRETQRHREQACPNHGKLMFWPELTGSRGDALTLWCPLCDAAVRRQQYPEETRIHP